jgi:hypothetical protein
MLNIYSKILTSIAILAIITSMSSCSAADLYGFDGLHNLENEMYNEFSYPNHDCWFYADYAAGRLSENGYKCAVVQGESDIGVSNHRALFVYMNEDNQLHKFESSRAVRERAGGLDYDWWAANAPLTTIEAYNGFDFSPLYGDEYG